MSQIEQEAIDLESQLTEPCPFCDCNCIAIPAPRGLTGSQVVCTKCFYRSPLSGSHPQARAAHNRLARSARAVDLLKEAGEALEHMKHCRWCGEDSWEECEGGRQAIAALAEIDALTKGEENA